MLKIIKKEKTGNSGYLATVPCSICNKEIKIILSRAKKQNFASCSKDCLLQYQKTVGAKKVIEAHKKNNHNISQGCGLTTDGYIWIYVKGKFHNQIKLHRYLMEIKLGRELKSSEIVHHIDGNKLNNTIENLELTTISEHNKKHRNFCVENRKDCYSEEEEKDLMKLTYDEFLKKYPHRTRDAIHAKRAKLKMSPTIKIGNI